MCTPMSPTNIRLHIYFCAGPPLLGFETNTVCSMAFQFRQFLGWRQTQAEKPNMCDVSYPSHPLYPSYAMHPFQEIAVVTVCRNSSSKTRQNLLQTVTSLLRIPQKISVFPWFRIHSVYCRQIRTVTFVLGERTRQLLQTFTAGKNLGRNGNAWWERRGRVKTRRKKRNRCSSSPSCCHHDFSWAQSHVVRPCFLALPIWPYTSHQTVSSDSALYPGFLRSGAPDRP